MGFSWKDRCTLSHRERIIVQRNLSEVKCRKAAQRLVANQRQAFYRAKGDLTAASCVLLLFSSICKGGLPRSHTTDYLGMLDKRIE